MLYAIFVIGAVFCALMAMASRSLLASTVWLAGVSALVSVLMYMMGAEIVAAIELSVGAGLVTVLFVFAISISGSETNEPGPKSALFSSIAATLTIIATTLLVWMILPMPESAAASAAGPVLTFAEVLWQQRSLDVLIQVVLIAAGAMGVLGLISSANEADPPPTAHAMEETQTSSNGHTAPEIEEKCEDMEVMV